MWVYYGKEAINLDNLCQMEVIQYSQNKWKIECDAVNKEIYMFPKAFSSFELAQEYLHDLCDKQNAIKRMTSPQNQLYYLAERIRHLTDLFEGDERQDFIFDVIRQIESQTQDLINSQKRLENQMNLIITLLNK